MYVSWREIEREGKGGREISLSNIKRQILCFMRVRAHMRGRVGAGGLRARHGLLAGHAGPHVHAQRHK